MDWKDIAGKIASAAPAIGAALAPATGGISLLAGAAIGVLAKALGVKEDPQAVNDALEAASGNAPALAEIRLKLMAAENEFMLKQRDQDITELKTRLADVQSARARQTEGEKATGTRDMNLYVLAWLLVIVFFFLTGMLLYFSYNGKPIADSTGVLFMLLGTLSAAFGGVIQYFFGSSAGSTAKSATIAGMMDKKGG